MYRIQREKRRARKEQRLRQSVEFDSSCPPTNAINRVSSSHSQEGQTSTRVHGFEYPDRNLPIPSPDSNSNTNSVSNSKSLGTTRPSSDHCNGEPFRTINMKRKRTNSPSPAEGKYDASHSMKMQGNGNGQFKKTKSNDTHPSLYSSLGLYNTFMEADKIQKAASNLKIALHPYSAGLGLGLGGGQGESKQSYRSETKWESDAKDASTLTPRSQMHEDSLLLLSIAGVSTSPFENASYAASEAKDTQPQGVGSQSDAMPPSNQKSQESEEDKKKASKYRGYVKFEDRIEQLKAFKKKYGHLRVTSKEDKNLHTYCNNVRYARRYPNGAIRMRISEKRIQALNELGFDWDPTRTRESRPTSTSTSAKTNSNASPSMYVPRAQTAANKGFEAKVAQLKAFKEKHGHLNVKKHMDSTLYSFCMNVRSARRRPGVGLRLYDERIQVLDEIGFEWHGKKRDSFENKINETVKEKVKAPTNSRPTSPSETKRTFKSFEERLDELVVYKKKFGHLKVSRSYDKSLYAFCTNIRAGRRNPGAGMNVTHDRIEALDKIGFLWGNNIKTIDGEEKISSSPTNVEENLNVPSDSNLNGSPSDARMETSLNDSNAQSIFDKKSLPITLSNNEKPVVDTNFEPKALAKSENLVDKTRGEVPDTIRSASQESKDENETRGNQVVTLPDTLLTETDGIIPSSTQQTQQAQNVKLPDTLLPESMFEPKITDEVEGKDGNRQLESSVDKNEGKDAKRQPRKRTIRQFESRVEQLKAFKKKHGHLRVKAKDDKSLHAFCSNVRNSFRNPGNVGIKLTQERIKSLDVIGFDWNPSNHRRSVKFDERIEQLASFKSKHGHINVKISDDKGLHTFCNNTKSSLRKPRGKASKLSEARLTILRDLGFEVDSLNQIKSPKEDFITPDPIEKKALVAQNQILSGEVVSNGEAMPAKDKEIPLVDSSDDEEIREEVILQKENAKPEIEIADA